MNILAVIPARGGSKGIPRKNLRLLNNKPLIYYSINTALNSNYDLDVYVSSEDEEIINIATGFGAKVHRRNSEIASDATTLDPVVYECYKYAEGIEEKQYDFIITIQATSPLLKTHSLDQAISKIIKEDSIDTVIAAKDDTHLSWKLENGKYIPNYKARVNRQYLTPVFRETGGFFITCKNVISPINRIGKNVELYILSNGEEIDIDTYEDWNLCTYHLQKKHIVFVVTGNKITGLGHVYNTLLVANDILNHKITFLVDTKSSMAYEKIALKNYTVYMQEAEDIVDDIKRLNPDVIINDRLDTSTKYMDKLRELDVKIINFEDLGEGAKMSDLTINAIYPENQKSLNHYYGYEYFILRDEFIYSKQKETVQNVENILITFGGVDPNNYTKKVLEAIYNYCEENKKKIQVITGFGYNNYESLNEYKNIDIQKNVLNISKYMYQADLIFTSAGRTTYEIASINVPTIVMAQNEREMTHFFASDAFGFLNLGLGYQVSRDLLYNSFIELISSSKKRVEMSALMRGTNLKAGRKKVNQLINSVLENI